MQNIYSNKKKLINQNIGIKRFSQVQHIGEKQTVDINKLLNRVKINKKNEIIRKIIFYSFIIFGLSSAGVLISFLK